MAISWKIKVLFAYFALMTGLAVMMQGCSVDKGAQHLVVQLDVSETVNRMPEVQLLTQHEVMQIVVVCAKKEIPADPFALQIGYWPKKLGSRTIYTGVSCSDYGTQMFILPTKAGWEVHAVTENEARAAPDVIRLVADVLTKATK